eukprot:m.53625 g.53625  ORF g.53625 m.53625 type:complete len:505 (+) comp10875_c0_seq2:219-1733(+)
MMSQPWRNVHKLITGYGVQRSNMLYCAPKRWELQCCALSSCNAKEIEGIPLKEYAARRKRLKDLMPEKGVAIQFGAPVKYMAPDVSYRFRQNSSLRYLTGFMEKDAVLLVFGKAMKEPDTLIVQTQDAHQDLWNGPCFGPDGAKEYTQIDHTSPLAELEKVVLEACMHASHVLIDTAKVLLMQLFAMNLPFLPSCVQVEHRTNSEQVFKTLNTLGIGSDQSQAPLAPLKPLLDELRLCKSSAEIKNIRKACNISGDAIQDAIKLSQADINESLLEANIEYGSRIRGASRLAYPPVIAGGARAGIIHYIENNQCVQDGELVLVDAGAEYNGYCGDISRTWPVTGSFSEAQAQVYDAVLNVQLECINACQPGMNLTSLHRISVQAMEVQLRKLGLPPSPTRRYYPHSIGHHLGLDVHDVSTVSPLRSFEAGMVVTVEPGLYIPDAYDIPEKYRGIGVRIEDDILITEDGHENLTKGCPKTREELERVYCRRVSWDPLETKRLTITT